MKIFIEADVLGKDKASNIFYPHPFAEGAEVELGKGAVLREVGRTHGAMGSHLQLMLALDDKFDAEDQSDHLVTDLCHRLLDNVTELQVGDTKIMVGKVARATTELALKGALLSRIRK